MLACSFPLDPALSRWLYETAVDLHSSGSESTRVAGDLGEGVVRDLRSEALVGTIGGPCFEARLETPRGSGLVRFLVTREGLRLREEKAEPTCALTLN